MDVKGMISTGAMILVGIIALKAFGGVKGITEMVGGIGDLLGTGGAPSAGAAPAVGIMAPETLAQVAAITEMPLPEVVLVAETQEVESTYDLLQTLSLIGGPIGYIAAPLILDPLEESQKAEVLKTYVKRRGAKPKYIPSALPLYQPPSTPTMQIIIPTDPSHPATDPFLGGR